MVCLIHFLTRKDIYRSVFLTLPRKDLFANPNNEEKQWEFFEKAIRKAIGKKKKKINWMVGSRTRYYLFRFIYKMKKGDYVVVPVGEEFSVYKIVGDKVKLPGEIENTNGLEVWGGEKLGSNKGKKMLCVEETEIDLGFFWEVEPVFEWKARKEFADNILSKKMKYRGTNLNITEFKASVNKAIKAVEKDRPINLYGDLQKKLLKSTLDTIKTDLKPSGFENLVSSYFKSIGAECEIPSKREQDKEGDADVIATWELSRTIIYVQVKLHDGQTDDWAVQQIRDYKGYKEEEDGYSRQAWVVTTGDKFSKTAKDEAAKNNVRLITGKEFAGMLLDAGMDFLRTFSLSE